MNIEAVKRVADTGQAAKVDGVLMDILTAGAIKAVYDGLSPESQARYEAMDLERAATIAWKLVKR